MKKITSIFVVAAALFATVQLTSCKKKDDPKTIVGTWNSVSFSTVERTNGTITSQSSIDFPGLLVVTINGDNTYKRSSPLDPTVVENGTYQTIGTKIVLNYTEDGVSMSDTSDYEFSEDSLIFKETTTETSGSDTIITEDKSTFKRA